MSMIEKAARAICANSGSGFCSDMGEYLGCKAGRGELPHWSICKASVDQLHLSRNMDTARAVLESIREPTKAILAAVDGEDSDPMVARGRAYSAWQAMIDTALSTETR